MKHSKPQLVSSNEFYDSIAGDYDEHLKVEKDQAVRNEVRDYFKKVVELGAILDFGGGTGLDLPWLTDAGYKIYFCEPSNGMKSKALELCEQLPGDKKPIFLKDKELQFQNWHTEKLPVNEKVTGVLANFGVVNYIDDLPMLFEKMSLIIDDNGSLIINLLYARPKKLMTTYLKNTIKATIRGEKVKTGSRHKNMIHETTLYSVHDLKKAAKPYFDLKMHRILAKKSDFLLLHFIKK